MGVLCCLGTASCTRLAFVPEDEGEAGGQVEVQGDTLCVQNQGEQIATPLTQPPASGQLKVLAVGEWGCLSGLLQSFKFRWEHVDSCCGISLSRASMALPQLSDNVKMGLGFTDLGPLTRGKALFQEES